MASCKVIGGIFFAADELFGVEELTVSPGSDLVNDGGLEVQEHGSWDVFPGSGLAEKRVEGIVSSADGFVAWHLSIRLKKNP